MSSSYSMEAEQTILSIMLVAGDGEISNKISRMLNTQDFYVPDHQAIWKTIQDVRLNGHNVDPVMICDSNDTINLEYVIDICKSFGSASNAVAYANIVKDRAKERAAVAALHDAVAVLSDKEVGKIGERLKRAENMVMSALSESSNTSSGLIHVEQIAKNWTKELVDRIEGVNPVRGFTTGVGGLDSLIAPKLIPPGSLVVAGARPKMGKSALLTMMADHFAGKLRKQTAIFSMEMPSNQVWERLLTGGIGMSPDKFFQPLSPEDYYDITTYSSDRMGAPLYIDDTPGITVGHIKSEARKLSRKGEVGLICVDYLTLMDADKADRNDLAYGKITKELKNLARELGCVVLLLTQLNRSIESRPILERKPMPSDSRDTGQIEQDCDLWMGLFRAGAYEPECKHPGLTHLTVRLNRHGKAGTVFLDMREGYFKPVSQYDGEIMEQANADYIMPAKSTSKGYRG